MYEKTIARFKKPIGSGMDRCAYYSPKYNLVFKRDHTRLSRQTIAEIEIFERMTEEEKQVFPIVAVVEIKKIDKKQVWLVMKKISRIEPEKFRKVYSAIYNSRDCRERDIMPIANGLEEETNFSAEKTINFFKFINKYDIGDLHRENIGCIGDQLVIIDAGL